MGLFEMNGQPRILSNDKRVIERAQQIKRGWWVEQNSNEVEDKRGGGDVGAAGVRRRAKRIQRVEAGAFAPIRNSCPLLHKMS